MVLKPLNFGEKLKLFRRMRKMSMAEAARKTGVTPERYEDIEEAMHEPRAGDILRIMRGLDIFFDPEDFDQEGRKP